MTKPYIAIMTLSLASAASATDWTCNSGDFYLASLPQNLKLHHSNESPYLVFDEIKIEAKYVLKGLERRWFWGENNAYQVILEPDLSAGYYDFNGVPSGETTKASSRFKCKKVEPQ